MSPNPSAALAQTVEVETPELVVLSYTLAGIGSRSYAALVDAIVCFLLLIVALLGIATIAPTGGLAGATPSAAWILAALILLQFLLFWGYYVFCEALFDGQTLGKRSQRIRVVREGGYSVTFGASAVRNLMRVVDMQPGIFYGVGMVSMLMSKTGKRLGDQAAGTLVVREDLVAAPSGPPPAAADAEETGPSQLHAALTDPEFVVLERFLQRHGELDRARRVALSHQLAGRFGVALAGVEGPSDGERLERLYASERAARARGLAARSDTGAARERHAIVAAGSARWATFAARLRDAQKRGLARLGEDGVREFVREYREITADLARLRTASRGREAGEVFYLNRLIAGAHNLLYRRRAIPPRRVVDYFFEDVPREIRASAVPILLAAVLLFGPAAIAYTSVVRHPEIAETLVPPGMLDRAEDGVRRAETGDGYIDDPQIFRPVMASSIIANNVQVSFLAFAFGVTAGVMTAWLLLANGISLGAVFGLYASKGILGLLTAFVAPHGVIELTAICIAGGAGFLLAAGLLLPGRRTRRTALIENGRRAIRLVAGTVLMLIVAGAIEGMVSPIPWWPLEVKLAVAGATAVLLYVYLRLGTGPVREPLAP